MRRRDESVGAAAHVHGGRAVRSVERTDGHTRAIRLGVLIGLAAVLATAVVVDGEPEDAASAPAAPERVAALMPASSPADAQASTWYCAAGTAVDGGMADHTVTMLNPTDGPLVAAVTVFAGAMVGDGEGAHGSVTREIPLPAGEEVALRLAEVVEAPLAAALVEVDGGDVAVSHRVAGPHGGDVAPCSTVAAPTWHLAWGATTRDTRDVVVLFNPFPSGATVDAVFATEDGGREPVRLQGLPVPPHSVVGVDLGDDVTRSEQVSATFAARSGNVVVEHLQEYDGSLEVRGLSLAPGVSAPGETWVFADGEASTRAPVTPPPEAGTDGADDADADESSSGEDTDTEPDEAASDDTDPDGEAASDSEAANDDEAPDDESGNESGDDEPDEDESIATERIVVYNPGEERAEVDVQVIPAAVEGEDDAAPAPQPFGLSVGPGRFEVLDLGDEERVPEGVPHTTVVRSTNGVGVVAERVTADHGPVPEQSSQRSEAQPRTSEISATTGSRLAAPVWRFLGMGDPEDEGSTVSFVVYNPDPAASVSVRVDLLPDGAATAGDAEEDAEDDAAEDTTTTTTTGSDDPEDTDRSTADGASDDDSGEDDDSAGDSDEAAGPDGLTAPVRVGPGEQAVIELDADQAAVATAAILEADGPVVVDRVVRLEDGRRRSLGGGIPAAAGALALDRPAADGWFGARGG
ncbi:MAG TPA: DUF5719 family protein [Acidimicrobiales bacterium]|nr:DUF5719 family protein [Acidimicrobiales bacterium]